jgi:hypothetical protein
MRGVSTPADALARIDGVDALRMPVRGGLFVMIRAAATARGGGSEATSDAVCTIFRSIITVPREGSGAIITPGKNIPVGVRAESAGEDPARARTLKRLTAEAPQDTDAVLR